MYCTKCKVEVPDGSKFCLQCGARLPINNGNLKTQNRPGTPTQPLDSTHLNRVTCYVDESLFQKPNIESSVVAQLSRGDTLSIIKEEEGFYYAKLETGGRKGLTGYVGMWVVVPPETEEQEPPESVSSIIQQNRVSTVKGVQKSLERNMNLIYTGDGADLLWHWLGWIILTAITLGIYSPWAINNFCRYVVEHTEIKKS